MRGCVNVSTKKRVVVPPDVLARLNEAIDSAKLRHGLTSNQQLAIRAGIDPMTLNALRWGHTAKPSDRVAWALDPVLGFEQGKGIQRIFAGRRVVRLPAEAKDALEDVPESASDVAIREILERVRKIEGMGNLKPEQKDRFIKILLGQVDLIVDQAEEDDRRQRDTA